MLVRRGQVSDRLVVQHVVAAAPSPRPGRARARSARRGRAPAAARRPGAAASGHRTVDPCRGRRCRAAGERHARGHHGAPAEQYDALLLDLDGTLHRGPDPVPGAAEAMTGARAAGRRLSFVTNNASRTQPGGPPPARRRRRRRGERGAAPPPRPAPGAGAGWSRPGSPVLVVGGDGLSAAVVAEGLRPGRLGHGPTGRRGPGLVSRAVLACARRGRLRPRDGVPWVATNVDLTLPTRPGWPGQRLLRRARPRSAAASPTSSPASPAPSCCSRPPAATAAGPSWSVTGSTPTSPAPLLPGWTCSSSPG